MILKNENYQKLRKMLNHNGTYDGTNYYIIYFAEPMFSQSGSFIIFAGHISQWL